MLIRIFTPPFHFYTKASVLYALSCTLLYSTSRHRELPACVYSRMLLHCMDSLQFIKSALTGRHLGYVGLSI